MKNLSAHDMIGKNLFLLIPYWGKKSWGEKKVGEKLSLGKIQSLANI